MHTDLKYCIIQYPHYDRISNYVLNISGADITIIDCPEYIEASVLTDWHIM